jgi:hypothetical protein
VVRVLENKVDREADVEMLSCLVKDAHIVSVNTNDCVFVQSTDADPCDGDMDLVSEGDDELDDEKVPNVALCEGAVIDSSWESLCREALLDGVALFVGDRVLNDEEAVTLRVDV